MCKFTNSIWILTVAFLTSCGIPQKHAEASTAQKEISAPGAKLTAAMATEIAAKVARQNKIRLENYDRPEITFDSAGREWHLFYMHKAPGAPGDHFTIYVNDETGETKFFGGA